MVDFRLAGRLMRTLKSRGLFNLVFFQEVLGAFTPTKNTKDKKA